MLGRAKWDSWNKQKGSEKVDAKMRYVTALIRVSKVKAAKVMWI
jgi:acyl-CoA-binding protein